MKSQNEILAEIDLGLDDSVDTGIKPPEGNYFGNLVRTGLGQGFALGFGDEIEGAFRSAVSQFTDDPKTYEQIRDEVRNQIKRFSKDNPGAAITSELVGGIVPTVAAMVTGVGAPAAVGNLARLANTAKVGAAAGLGYSESDSVTGQAFDAGTGAVTAVAASEALRQVAKASGMGYDAVVNALRNKFGNEYAGRVTAYLNKLRERTGKSIDETVEYVRDGGVMAEDDQLVASIRDIAAKGGDAAGDIKNAASARAEQTMDAATQSVRRALAPDIDDGNVARALKETSEQAKASQSAVYENIFNEAKDVPKSLSDRMVGMMRQNADVRKMFIEDYNTAKLTQPNLKPLFKMVKNDDGTERFVLNRNITLRDAEEFRRNLGEMAQMQFDSPNRRNAPGFNYRMAEQNLRSQIDKFSPELSAVRGEFAGREAVDAAIKLGRQMAGKNPDDIAVAMDGLSPEELAGFRAGMQISIRKKMSDSANYAAQAGGLQVSNQTPNQVMRTILPEDQADSVIKDLARAGRANINNVKVKPAGGAITEFQRQAGDELSGIGFATSAGEAVTTKNPFAIARTVQALIPQDLGLNDQQKQRVVEILFSQDADLVKAALTDRTAFGQLNKKVFDIASGLVQIADSAIKRQVPAGLVESL